MKPISIHDDDMSFLDRLKDIPNEIQLILAASKFNEYLQQINQLTFLYFLRKFGVG